MTIEERNKAIMENPLLDWSKDQVKSALKKHSKKELLIIAMQWRMKAEEWESKYDELLEKIGGDDDNEVWL